MTYTFKLARRLAVSRVFGVLSLLLLAACAADDSGPAGPTPPDDIPPAAIILTPEATSTLINHTVQFVAYTASEDGDPEQISVEWEASGGTISPDGVFRAEVPGTYSVIGRGKNGKGHGRADTAKVTVRNAQLVVAPDTVELEVSESHQFTAQLEAANGTTKDAEVTWSATGGEIGSDGLFTAGQEAGNYHVVAASVKGDLVDSSVVTIVQPPTDEPPTEEPPTEEPPTEEPPSDGGRTFEPAGYSRILEWAFTELPADPCLADGILGGCFRYYGNVSIQVDPTAPVSAGEVAQIKFPEGLSVGAGPGQISGWATASELSSTEYEEVYESGWFKMPSNDFEVPGPGMKLLGYWGVGQRGEHVPNQVYGLIRGNGSSTSIGSSWTLDIIQQNHIDRRLVPNRNTSKRVTAGRWNHYEILMRVNDLGAANGVLKVWLDGELIMEYSDVVYRNADNPSGFYGRSWAPIWGGMGGAAKSRDDFLWIDHVYTSGIPMN